MSSSSPLSDSTKSLIKDDIGTDVELETLEQQLKQVEEAIEKKKQKQLLDALDQAKALAKSVGFTLQELIDYEKVILSEKRKEARRKNRRKSAEA